MSVNPYDQDEKSNHEHCWSGLYRGGEIWWFDNGSACMHPAWHESLELVQS